MVRVPPRVGAAAAVVGGGLWVLKGGLILATGEQPPYAFEVAPAFFAVALLGARGGLASTRAVRVGGALAWVALGFGALAAASVVAPALEPAIGLAFLALLGSLLALGTAHRYALGLGVAMPALALGVPGVALLAGMDEAALERLIEVPIVLLGIAWAGFGAALVRKS